MKFLKMIFVSAFLLAQSASADIGVIDKDGKTRLYFFELGFVRVHQCLPYTVFGHQSDENRSSCLEKRNRIPLETFKEALKKLIVTGRGLALGPLTYSEVDAYASPLPSDEEIKAMSEELKKIEDFIRVYGQDNANVLRRNYLTLRINARKNRESAVVKIAAETKKISEMLLSDTLTVVKYSEDKTKFIFKTLADFNPSNQFTCGLQGSVEERIFDCNFNESANIGNYVLVSRDLENKVIYKQLDSDQLWISINHRLVLHKEAEELCHSLNASDLRLGKLNWDLPSKKQLLDARKNKIHLSSNRLSGSFWAKDKQAKLGNAWTVSTLSGSVIDRKKDYVASVLCTQVE